jgi:hypothetical protein
LAMASTPRGNADSVDGCVGQGKNRICLQCISPVTVLKTGCREAWPWSSAPTESCLESWIRGWELGKRRAPWSLNSPACCSIFPAVPSNPEYLLLVTSLMISWCAAQSWLPVLEGG